MICSKVNPPSPIWTKQNFVSGTKFFPATCSMNSNSFEFLQHVAGTEVICHHMSLRENSSCSNFQGQTGQLKQVPATSLLVCLRKRTRPCDKSPRVSDERNMSLQQISSCVRRKGHVLATSLLVCLTEGTSPWDMSPRLHASCVPIVMVE